MIKKYFVTGLVILLPVAVTVAIITFVINFLTAPFVGFFEQLLTDTQLYAAHKGIVHFILQIFFLATLFGLTLLLGFLARMVVFKSMLSLYDYILHRIPVIKTIYKTAQQVIKTLLGGQSRSFKQVVMAPFPTNGSYAIGLVSGTAPQSSLMATGKSLITVFIPTTPNPTSGFLILYDEREVIYLDMKVENAIKYIISCGVLHSSDSDLLA
jgi:uncharacterized membrane protein